MARSKCFSITFIAILCAVLVSCKKESKTISKDADPEISAAKAFFSNYVSDSRSSPNRQNFRSNQSKTILWDQAQKVNLPEGMTVVVPVSYAKNLYVSAAVVGDKIIGLNDITKLIITKDSSNSYCYTLCTFIPDSVAISSETWTSGIILSEDWQGNSLDKPRRFFSNSTATTNQQNVKTDPAYVQTIQTCNEIDGYNYSPDDPSGGFAWSETTCTSYNFTTLIPDNPSTPGGAISSVYGVFPIPPAVSINLPPPGNPIGNITDYFKCFSQGDGGHSFSVTLAIEQPVQGTRTPWTFTRGGLSGSSVTGNPVNVGHTWLIFTESTPSGTITRNVGFYPAALVSPFSPSAQGVLGDDEATNYNISLSVSLNSSQFFSMLNFVSQGNNQGYLYDLNQNNCTSFALDAMAVGNVVIPSTVGHWVGNGQGLDPGDLGEDVRNMALSNGMTRNTVSNSHPNTSSCNL
jgi:hypothetical protein